MSNQLNFTPENLRHLLIQSALAVVNGRLTPKEATAIAALSSEVHKSIKMEHVSNILDGDKALRNEQVVQVLTHVK